MSGSNSDYGVPSGPSGPAECELLFIKTNLASPDPAVLATLHVDDELDVLASSPAGPAQVLAEGNIAGSIVSPQLMRLLGCLEQGHEYVAIVRHLNGGLCEVEVRIRST